MSARRLISIECRGISPSNHEFPREIIDAYHVLGNLISKEDLFHYTNGRFLLDEEIQFSKRYVRFDIDKLCDVVESVSGSERSPVLRVQKMEGGFSKALLMTTKDGSEYIVKIPCPNAGRSMYCTASEVAVLNFSEKQKLSKNPPRHFS
jgi:hypothetical protein